MYDLLVMDSGIEAGKRAAGEVLALQKTVLKVLNDARYVILICFFCLSHCPPSSSGTHTELLVFFYASLLCVVSIECDISGAATYFTQNCFLDFVS